MEKNTNRRRKTTRTQSGGDPQLDLVTQRNRAAQRWANADPLAVVFATGSGPGQEALTSAAAKLAGNRNESAARYAAHLRSLAIWAAGEVLDFVKEEEAAVLKDRLSQFVVQNLDAAPAGDGLTALAVVHAAQPELACKRPNPILPKLTVSAPGPERERGERLLGGLVPDEPGPELPLLPDAIAPRQRVPLLELADASGVVSMSRGQGAPPDLRLVVESVLSVGYELRSRDSVRIAWTVGELLAALEPKRPRGGKKAAWGRVHATVMRAGERWIPWMNGGRWWLLRVRGVPGLAPSLTDPVVVDVALPPGSAAGPVINRAALRRVGFKSAPAYRAMLAVHTLAWQPGVTRIPTSGVGAVWTGDASKYPVLTREDRKRLGFGPGTGYLRRPGEVDDAWREAPEIEVMETEAVDSEGRHGWLVVPSAAAAAIRKKRRKD